MDTTTPERLAHLEEGERLMYLVDGMWYWETANSQLPQSTRDRATNVVHTMPSTMPGAEYQVMVKR